MNTAKTSAYAMALVTRRPFLAVPWYLMAAYAYYVDDDPILTDAAWEWLARFLLKHYDEVNHPHKDLISREELEAGTYLGSYPERVVGGLGYIRATSSR